MVDWFKKDKISLVGEGAGDSLHAEQERLVFLVPHGTVGKLENKGVAFKVLNINLDTSTLTGKLMLTMLGAIAEFERSLMLGKEKGSRRRRGQGGTKAANPPPKKKPPGPGTHPERPQITKQTIADELGMGVESVCRILQEAKT